jgi:hypothetical protein
MLLSAISEEEDYVSANVMTFLHYSYNKYTHLNMVN